MIFKNISYFYDLEIIIKSLRYCNYMVFLDICSKRYLMQFA